MGGGGGLGSIPSFLGSLAKKLRPPGGLPGPSSPGGRDSDSETSSLLLDLGKGRLPQGQGGAFGLGVDTGGATECACSLFRRGNHAFFLNWLDEFSPAKASFKPHGQGDKMETTAFKCSRPSSVNARGLAACCVLAGPPHQAPKGARTSPGLDHSGRGRPRERLLCLLNRETGHAGKNTSQGPL